MRFRASRSRRRAPHLVRLRWVAALAVVALGGLALVTDIGRRVELQTIDLRFELRGDRPAPPKLLVVAIDDRSFDVLRDREEPWPFRRSLHAGVIDRLKAAGARVIAYDVEFTERSADGREDDALIGSVIDAGNVVLAATTVDEAGQHAVLGGDAALREFGARAGNAVLPTDPGGVVRRVGRVYDRLESFAVVAVERATGRRVGPGGFDEDGEAWIDFAGGPGTVTTRSFVDVLDGRVPAELIRDRTVVVGASVASLQDVKPTSASGSELMAGPEIQAAAIDTVARGLPLRRSPWPLDAAAILLLGIVAPLAAGRVGALRIATVVVALGGLYAAALHVAFGEGLILRATEPLATLAASALCAIALQYLAATFERQRTRDAFARFVPPAIVDSVLARAGDDGWLGGERLETTVLFSDLRGFTSFSESRPPDLTLRLLNAYLSEMTTAIMEEGGTITSYIGDGIMALFGAPVGQPDHADRALAAARAMQARLEHFNVWLADQGVDEGFRMGIGINTGPVMVGNIGSERRLEYTGIGDTVNTAARLEGMTKGTGFSIFVSDSTRTALTAPPADLGYVDELAVRGRVEGVAVWGLAVGPGTVPSATEPAVATKS